jgi:hypothetical protein
LIPPLIQEYLQQYRSRQRIYPLPALPGRSPPGADLPMRSRGSHSLIHQFDREAGSCSHDTGEFP